jgi:hypothetical protein
MRVYELHGQLATTVTEKNKEYYTNGNNNNDQWIALKRRK